MGSIARVIVNSSTEQVEVEPKRVTPGLNRISSIRNKLSQSTAAVPIESEQQVNDTGINLLSDRSSESNPMDPSTYYQVKKNMGAISDLNDQLNAIRSDLSDKVSDLNTSDSNLQKAIDALNKKIDNITDALSIKTDMMSANTPPSGYKHRITHEIKLASAVGLGPANGLTGTEQVYVQTVSTDGLNGVQLKTFQKATISGDISYVRISNSQDGWEPWGTVSGGGGGSSGDIIYSQSQPSAAAQKEGGLWLTNIG